MFLFVVRIGWVKIFKITFDLKKECHICMDITLLLSPLLLEEKAYTLCNNNIAISNEPVSFLLLTFLLLLPGNGHDCGKASTDMSQNALWTGRSPLLLAFKKNLRM